MSVLHSEATPPLTTVECSAPSTPSTEGGEAELPGSPGVHTVEQPPSFKKLTEAERLELAIRWGREHHGATDTNFVVGFDITSKEEDERRRRRAERFGFVGSKDQRSKRVQRFGVDAVEALKVVEKSHEPRRQPAVGEPLRLEAVYLYGTDKMSTKDILQGLFRDYCPTHCEWINDSSCNVVWKDQFSAKRVLWALGEVLPADQQDEVLPEELHWRKLFSEAGVELLMRSATVNDVKILGAARNSTYYAEHRRKRRRRPNKVLVPSSAAEEVDTTTDLVSKESVSDKPEERHCLSGLAKRALLSAIEPQPGFTFSPNLMSPPPGVSAAAILAAEMVRKDLALISASCRQEALWRQTWQEPDQKRMRMDCYEEEQQANEDVEDDESVGQGGSREEDDVTQSVPAHASAMATRVSLTSACPVSATRTSIFSRLGRAV